MPDKKTAKWDGFHFAGTCQHCGESIRRRTHRVWVLDWMIDEDGEPDLRPWMTAEPSCD